MVEDKQIIKIKDIPFLQNISKIKIKKIFNKMKGYKIHVLNKYTYIIGSENLKALEAAS